MTMTDLEVAEVLKRIVYKENFRLTFDISAPVIEGRETTTDDMWLTFSWQHRRPDAITEKFVTEKFEWGEGGKTHWPLKDLHSVEQLLKIVFMNVLALEEHEAREFFQYKGRRIFNPHMDLMAIAGLES